MMKALQATKADALHMTIVAAPIPSPGELLVKIVATSINPSDVLNASGGFSHTTFPGFLVVTFPVFSSVAHLD